jgi:hypothetical protein
MAKPVILAVNDDPQVLRAIERDLRRNYAREYRVLRADSGHLARRASLVAQVVRAAGLSGPQPGRLPVGGRAGR